MLERVGRHTHLFVEEDFKSHAGLDLHWKLEMDALDEAEWKCNARMIMEYQTEPFQAAIGIPRGGLKLSVYLNDYSTQNNNDPYLIVDDVLTTGGSMEEFKKDYFDKKKVFGWVVFSRQKPPDWVRTLFQMPIL